MCGLAGGITDDIALFLKHALTRLEYRGYDSWGYYVAYGDKGRHFVHREVGAPSKSGHPMQNGRLGIGHTRWATHGEVSTRNTHPIQSGGWFVVHNGVIENHESVRHPLYERTTQTDTEAIGLAINLTTGYYNHQSPRGIPRKPLPALHEAVTGLDGRYAFAAVPDSGPADYILLATTGSPLVVAPEEKLFASDVQALAGFVRKAYVVKPGYCLKLSAEGIESLPDADWRGPEIEVPEPDWVAASRDCPGPVKVRGQWMLQEMLEQPGLIRSFEPDMADSLDDYYEWVHLYGVGSSLHAAMLAEWFLSRDDVRLAVAHALDGASPDEGAINLFVAITQSGESKVVLDEMASNIRCDPHGNHVVLTNRPESSATRLDGLDDVILMGCGPERAVAATKSWTMTVLHLCGLLGDADLTGKTLSGLADAAEAVLSTDRVLRPVLIAGDGPEYAVALEGALKLKEVAYLHTEGVRLSDIQHGPLAMLQDDTPVLVLALDEPDVTRVMELASRRIPLTVVCREAEKEKFSFVPDLILLPDLPWQSLMILAGILLQKLSYNLAMSMGHDPDMPRHLAKSVTV